MYLKATDSLPTTKQKRHFCYSYFIERHRNLIEGDKVNMQKKREKKGIVAAKWKWRLNKYFILKKIKKGQSKCSIDVALFTLFEYYLFSFFD